MTKLIKISICFILCAFLLFGCSIDISGINNAVDAVLPKDVTGEMKEVTLTPSDNRPVEKLEFDNISFTGGEAKIIIVPAGHEETRVEAVYPAAMENHGFRITLREGEIEISAPRQTGFNAEKFLITVYADIREIDISGGIALEMNAEKAERLSIEVQGGTAVDIYNINAKHFETDIAGAVSAKLSGTAEYFEMSLAGAGAIDAKKLICQKAEVEISGAGTAELSVTNDLFVDMDGVGALKYYGDPMVKNLSGGLTDVEQVSKEVYKD